MKNILVPFDFSKPSINAFRVALDLASQSKGMVHLLFVYEFPTVSNTVLTPVRYMKESLVSEMGTKTNIKFEKIIEKYGVKGVKVVSKVDFGIPYKKILTYATAQSIDIIVMGSHGTNGIREYVIGSNAEKIVRTSSVPVLVVKDQVKCRVKNIVFPNTLDTENQKDLINKVKGLQKFFNAHLHIVHINTPAMFTSDSLTIDRLQAFTEFFKFKNFTVRVFNHWFEDQGIIAYADSIGADLIVMGTHGRKGLAHLVSGSMAEDVVNHVKSLIWTYVIRKGAQNVRS